MSCLAKAAAFAHECSAEWAAVAAKGWNPFVNCSNSKTAMLQDVYVRMLLFPCGSLTNRTAVAATFAALARRQRRKGGTMSLLTCSESSSICALLRLLLRPSCHVVLIDFFFHRRNGDIGTIGKPSHTVFGPDIYWQNDCIHPNSFGFTNLFIQFFERYLDDAMGLGANRTRHRPARRDL